MSSTPLWKFLGTPLNVTPYLSRISFIIFLVYYCYFWDTVDLQIRYRKQLTLFGSIPRVSIVRTYDTSLLRQIGVVLKIGWKREILFSIPIQFVVIYTTHKVSYFHYLTSITETAKLTVPVKYIHYGLLQQIILSTWNESSFKNLIKGIPIKLSK